jgi:hypothetical protein
MDCGISPRRMQVKRKLRCAEGESRSGNKNEATSVESAKEVIRSAISLVGTEP